MHANLFPPSTRSRASQPAPLFLVLLLDKQKKNACYRQTKPLSKMNHQITPEKLQDSGPDPQTFAFSHNPHHRKMMHSNLFPPHRHAAEHRSNCRKKSLNCLSASEFLNSRQLREAQGTRRVKWRGCPFLGSAFGQAKEERLLQANKTSLKDEPSDNSRKIARFRT